MKIQVKFLENKVTLTFTLDEKEIATTNQLDALRRNICSDKTSELARSNGCQVTIPEENAHQVAFDIKAKSQASITQFLKILVAELKAETLLSSEECEEINKKIQLEFARQYAANVPDDAFITIDASRDVIGLGNIIFVKKAMEDLITKAEAEITPQILQELKDLIDSYDKKQISPALGNRTLEKKAEENSFITIEKLLDNIRQHLTAIKKYIRDTLNHVTGVNELYDFLDSAGPKNATGSIQYTPLEANPFKTPEEQAKYEKRDPEYKNSKYWVGIVKIEQVEKKVEALQDERASQDEKVLAAALKSCTSLIRLYDKIYDKANDAQIPKSNEIAALVDPVVSYKTIEDFQKIAGAVKRLSRDESIPNLKKKNVKELKKTSKEKRVSHVTPVRLPVSLLPNGMNGNHVEHKSQTQIESMKEPLLDKNNESAKPQQTTFATRHPWVVRLAKAGAIVFGIFAVVSFFVPVPFLNLTLAAAFTKLSVACGTVAAVATMAAVCIGTPAVGSGFGAGTGRLLECTPCCKPTTNASMHKDLGALSINGPGARVEVPSDEFAYDFEEKFQQQSKYVPPTPEQTQGAKPAVSTATMRAN